MRIYGGHDYYDSGLSMGIDPSIVLVRNKSKRALASDAGRLLGSQLYFRPSNVVIDRVSVVFCTKLYQGALVYLANGVESFWNARKICRFAAAREKNGWVGPPCQNWRAFRSEPSFTLENYFSPVDVSGKTRQYMIRHKAAILVQHEVKDGENDEIEVNPTGLKQLGFASALDPYTAFQELSMWIGGVLGGTSPEIVRITDDRVLAESHGFDKHSFRGPRIK